MCVNDDCEGEATDYDYLSIMHYSSKSYSKNKKPTMQARIRITDAMGTDHGYNIPGHRYRLTPNDIEKINKQYGTPE